MCLSLTIRQAWQDSKTESESVQDFLRSGIETGPVSVIFYWSQEIKRTYYEPEVSYIHILMRKLKRIFYQKYFKIIKHLFYEKYL